MRAIRVRRSISTNVRRSTAGTMNTWVTPYPASMSARHSAPVMRLRLCPSIVMMVGSPDWEYATPKREGGRPKADQVGGPHPASLCSATLPFHGRDGASGGPAHHLIASGLTGEPTAPVI